MAQVNSQHIPGNLNFLANRKGWSRNFTLSPAEVANITYATLEHILELRTINLRGRRLRVYVEHPAGSGVWAPVRPWSDDGTLQAELVKAFFADRMERGVVTVLDVRDVAEPDINPHAPMHPRGWLRRGNTLTKHTSSRSDLHLDSDMDPISTDSRSGFFGRFKGSSKDSGMPDLPSLPSPPQSEEMEGEEMEMMEEHGWRPSNIVRRFTASRKRKDTTSSKSKGISKDNVGSPMLVNQAPTPARQESPIIDPTEFEPMDMRETAESAAERNVGLRRLLSRKSTKDVKSASSSPLAEMPQMVRSASDVGPSSAQMKNSAHMSMATDEGYSTAETSGEASMTFAPSPAMVVAGFGLANPSTPGSSSSAMPAFGVPMPPGIAPLGNGMKRISEVPTMDSSDTMAPPATMAPERITSIRSETRTSLSRAPSPRGARAPSPPKHSLPPVPVTATSANVPVECGNYDQLDHAELRHAKSASTGSKLVEMMQPERPVMAVH